MTMIHLSVSKQILV
jgi:hypothetical protein